MREVDLLVTGSSGFIGSHLCRAVLSDGTAPPFGLDIAPPEQNAEWDDVRADIRSRDELERVFAQIRPRVVVHLAAVAEAVVPFSELENLEATNVIGTLKLLEAATPDLFLLASSSAVYGNAHVEDTAPLPGNTRPVGTYGFSKAQAELAVSEWVHVENRRAVAFRFGNVVGGRCRGLIPYLVHRARRDPEASTPTRLRGEGRVIRDYVPVGFAVAMLRAAIEAPWRSGRLEVVNVGTGRGRTNADVAHLVQRVLRDEGYDLDLRFDAPLERGEASYVVLETSSSVRGFGIAIPGDDEVDAAITDATRYWLSVTE